MISVPNRTGQPLPYAQIFCSGGRIRTCAWRIQRPLAYHLPTPDHTGRPKGIEPLPTGSQPAMRNPYTMAAVPQGRIELPSFAYHATALATVLPGGNLHAFKMKPAMESNHHAEPFVSFSPSQMYSYREWAYVQHTPKHGHKSFVPGQGIEPRSNCFARQRSYHWTNPDRHCKKPVPRRRIELRPPALQTGAQSHESFRGKKAAMAWPPPS